MDFVLEYVAVEKYPLMSNPERRLAFNVADFNDIESLQ